MQVNGEGAILEGRSQLGYTEREGNYTKFGEWYGMNGVAWCAIFVSWCFWRAGTPLAISTSKGFSLVQASTDWAKKNGLWRSASTTPQRGWVVNFRFPSGPARDNHTALVQGAIRGGAWTLEGNTNFAGSRTGGSVLEKNRTSYISGYIALDQRVTAPQQIDWAALRRLLAAKLRASAGDLSVPLGANSPPSLYIVVLQQCLNLVSNAGLTEDGVYGPATINAVVNFQRFMNALGANLQDFPGAVGNPTKWWLCVCLDNIREGRA